MTSIIFTVSDLDRIPEGFSTKVNIQAHEHVEVDTRAQMLPN